LRIRIRNTAVSLSHTHPTLLSSLDQLGTTNHPPLYQPYSWDVRSVPASFIPAATIPPTTRPSPVLPECQIMILGWILLTANFYP
jgi:hypothetical protein